MRHIFFIALISVFTFSFNGMDDPISPSRPPRADHADVTPALPDLTATEVNNVAKLLGLCVNQIHNTSKLFAGQFTAPTDVIDFKGNFVGEDTKPRIEVAKIRDLFASLIDSVFLPRFKVPKGTFFTPANRLALGSHLKDITGDSPRSFVKKDEKHFEKSISPGAFCTIIETHFENKFYIPEWMLDPKLGFAFWRKSTNTLANGIEYGPYNVFKMLNGENPESNSGTMEHHHVYQTHSVVTPICWSEHKGKTTQYHKSKEKTKIDRSICGTEFHYINKMIAFLQMARMCRSVLEDTCAELSHETEALMKLISKYSGNIDVIPNESRSSVGRSLFTELAEAGDVISENSNGASSSEKDDKGTSPLIESRKRRRASSSSIKDLGEDENVNLAHELFPQVNRSTSLNPHRRKPLSLASINSSSVASFS